MSRIRQEPYKTRLVAIIVVIVTLTGLMITSPFILSNSATGQYLYVTFSNETEVTSDGGSSDGNSGVDDGILDEPNTDIPEDQIEADATPEDQDQIASEDKDNQDPLANAGSNLEVDEGSFVTLDGSESTDTDGFVSDFDWTQTNGPLVDLKDADESQPSFTAPDVDSNEELTFQLSVTDDKGASSTDTVKVSVKDITSSSDADTNGSDLNEDLLPQEGLDTSDSENLGTSEPKIVDTEVMNNESEAAEDDLLKEALQTSLNEGVPEEPQSTSQDVDTANATEISMLGGQEFNRTDTSAIDDIETIGQQLLQLDNMSLGSESNQSDAITTNDTDQTIIPYDNASLFLSDLNQTDLAFRNDTGVNDTSLVYLQNATDSFLRTSNETQDLYNETFYNASILYGSQSVGDVILSYNETLPDLNSTEITFQNGTEAINASLPVYNFSTIIPVNASLAINLTGFYFSNGTAVELNGTEIGLENGTSIDLNQSSSMSSVVSTAKVVYTETLGDIRAIKDISSTVRSIGELATGGNFFHGITCKFMSFCIPGADTILSLASGLSDFLKDYDFDSTIYILQSGNNLLNRLRSAQDNKTFVEFANVNVKLISRLAELNSNNHLKFSKAFASSVGDAIIWLGKLKKDLSWVQTGQKIKTIHDDLVKDGSQLVKIQKLIDSYLKRSSPGSPKILLPTKPNLPSLPSQPDNVPPKIITKTIIKNQQTEKEDEKQVSTGSLPIIVTILNADPNIGHELNAFIIKGGKFIQSKPLVFTKIESAQIANAIIAIPRQELSIGGDFIVCVTQNSGLDIEGIDCKITKYLGDSEFQMVQFVLPSSGKFKSIVESHATDTEEIEIEISKNSYLSDNIKSFVPLFVRINRGDTIIWKNNDLTQHTVTSGEPNSTDSGNEFQSSLITSGSSFKHVFEAPGSYGYYCRIHPIMKGSIIVN